MEKINLPLKAGSEYIELTNILKFLNLANSGGHANLMITEGLVSVNGEIETRKRKKIRSGEVVKFEDTEITVL